MNDSNANGPVPTGFFTSKPAGTMPSAYCASWSLSRAYGYFSVSWTVVASIFLSAAGSIIRSPEAPAPGAFGSRIRRSEKITSSASTVLPLWNSAPSRSRSVQTRPPWVGSIETPTIGSISYAALRRNSGS